ncbi:aldo/keto reductase, partial [Paenibacillus sepulcri]|nr:aldo/keto reductase [Paenibacillus sepulcri]
RERVVLGTKVGRMFDDDIIDGPNQPQGLSLYKIRRHFEASLKRLQTDHIELYQMHHVDRNVLWEELWEAFEGLVRQGKVDYIGSSNFAGRDLLKAQSSAKERHFMGLISEQHGYSLVNRYAELDTLPTARDLGIGVTIFSPLARGLLALDITRPVPQTLSGHARKLLESHRPQLEQYSALCRELGEKEAHVALAWLLANPAISAPIIGPCTVAELEDSLRAVEIELDEPTLRRLDEIFPAPRELNIFQ